MIFGEEEYPLGDVAAASNSAQGGRAVEATVDAAAAMTAERPGAIAWIRLAVWTDKFPNRFHKMTIAHPTKPGTPILAFKFPDMMGFQGSKKPKERKEQSVAAASALPIDRRKPELVKNKLIVI